MCANYVTSRGRGDEFYTRYCDVERMLTQYLEALKDMHVLCPCDSDESAYVRFMHDHGIKVTWSTGDYEQYDFGDYDIVITNPPFSCMAAFMRKLVREAHAWHIIMPESSLGSNATCEAVNARDCYFHRDGAASRFMRPDGSELHVGCTMFTTFEHNDTGVHVHHEAYAPRPGVPTRDGQVLYDRTAHVPHEFSGEILVPGGWLESRYDASKYEVLGNSSAIRMDGSNSFRRIIIRMRHDA